MDLEPVIAQHSGGESRNLSGGSQVKFLWNSDFERNFKEVSEIITSFQPDFVVLGVGLWFLVDRKKSREEKFESYERNYRQMLAELSRHLPSSVPIVLHTQTQSVRYPEDHLYHEEDIRRLNTILRRIASDNKSDQYVLWDSHLALQKEYVSLCRSFYIPDDEYGNAAKSPQWTCGDENHSGYVVVDQFAQMLLKQFRFWKSHEHVP